MAPRRSQLAPCSPSTRHRPAESNRRAHDVIDNSWRGADQGPNDECGTVHHQAQQGEERPNGNTGDYDRVVTNKLPAHEATVTHGARASAEQFTHSSTRPRWSVASAVLHRRHRASRCSSGKHPIGGVLRPRAAGSLALVVTSGSLTGQRSPREPSNQVNRQNGCPPGSSITRTSSCGWNTASVAPHSTAQSVAAARSSTEMSRCSMAPWWPGLLGQVGGV